MKLWALITDTFREIYAKKVIIGIIGIEILTLAITAAFLAARPKMMIEPDAGPPAARDSVRITSPAPPPLEDTALLGTDSPLDSVANRPRTSSRTFDVPPDQSTDFQRGMQRSLAEAVRGQLGMFTMVIGAAMIFLGIFVTAGIVPSIMEKGSIDLLLSKPISRTTILLGRALGGVIAIALNLFLFVLAMWALYGIFTGVWVGSFLVGATLIPLFTFVVIYSAVILLNVVTESWVLPISLVYLHVIILATFLRGREETLFRLIGSDAIKRFIDGLYYALPQTADLIATATPQYVMTSSVDNLVPFIQGTIFTGVMLSLAIWKFQKKDF
ncbi:MAG: ABC transporter permease [Candidatus Kapaibacterium sp.]